MIPASLSTVLTISEGGFVTERNGKVTLLFGELFTSSYSWSVVLLALVSVLYISAMFLTYYANKAQDDDALEIVRGYALGWSPPTILCSLFVFFAIILHNPQHFRAMLDFSWISIASFLCFLAAVYLVLKRKNLGWAFILVMLQFAFAFFGYGASHLPYILYPFITIYQNFTSGAMAIALIAAFIAGLFLLIPSLALLMRLFLFDAEYVKGNPPRKDDWVGFFLTDGRTVSRGSGFTGLFIHLVSQRK